MLLFVGAVEGDSQYTTPTEWLSLHLERLPGGVGRGAECVPRGFREFSATAQVNHVLYAARSLLEMRALLSVLLLLLLLLLSATERCFLRQAFLAAPGWQQHTQHSFTPAMNENQQQIFPASQE